MVFHAYNTSYSGGWGGRIAWTQEAKIAVNWDCTTALQSGQQSEIPTKKKRKDLKSTAEMLASAPKCNKAVMCLMEKKRGVLDKLCSGTHSSVAWEFRQSRVY